MRRGRIPRDKPKLEQKEQDVEYLLKVFGCIADRTKHTYVNLWEAWFDCRAKAGLNYLAEYCDNLENAADSTYSEEVGLDEE